MREESAFREAMVVCGMPPAGITDFKTAVSEEIIVRVSKCRKKIEKK